MLGTLNSDEKNVTVVGAGVSGLLAAYRLDRAGYEVTLIEAQARSGGLISTRQTPFGIAETAAHSLLASPAVLQLFEELSLHVVEVRKSSRARFILRNGRFRKMPLSLVELLGLLGRLVFARAQVVEAQSLEEWGRTHLGQAAVDFLLAPFLVGVYGASPVEISVQAAFSKLEVPAGRTLLGTILSKRRKRETPPSARPRMVSLVGGTQSLVSALEIRLKERLGSRFRLGCEQEDLPESPNTVISVPAQPASQLLKRRFLKSSIALSRIKYAPLVCCTVFIRNDRHVAPRGVGVLIPPKENHPILGVLFNSSAFPGRVANEAEMSSYTVMLGGTVRPELVNPPDGEIRRLIESELGQLIGLRGDLEHIEIVRWSRAIPIYSTELKSAWAEVGAELQKSPGLVLFGNYTGQVSLRGMIETSVKLAP